MINGKLRPWGKVGWFFQQPSIRPHAWFLIGAVSTQERCRALLGHRGRSLQISGCGLLEVHDSTNAPPAFAAISRKKIEGNRDALIKLSPERVEIARFGLLDPLYQLKQLVLEWIAKYGGNIIFDVSTLPERFCFPILRWLAESGAVQNLVLTYMLAETYTEEDLGYDSQDWGQLPTFVGDESTEATSRVHVIVGVGFLPYSLPDWLKKTYTTPNFQISLLLPFPAPPANAGRAWSFVRGIERDLPLSRDDQILRVSPVDLWGAFQRIDSLTQSGRARAVFAPYGPKPHSLAMGIHAIRHSSEVYFTQPTYYHPEYSSGIPLESNLPIGYAYAMRLGGHSYY